MDILQRERDKLDELINARVKAQLEFRGNPNSKEIQQAIREWLAQDVLVDELETTPVYLQEETLQCMKAQNRQQEKHNG